MTLALETTQSENVLLRKQLADTQALLRRRKERKKGKRVALKGRFVFSTQEVLDIAKAAEAETANKKAKNRANKKAETPPDEDSDDEVVEIDCEDSDSDCITVAPARSYRR
jgi:hypothetical protein